MREHPQVVEPDTTPILGGVSPRRGLEGTTIRWQPPWLSSARAQGIRTGCSGLGDAHCLKKDVIGLFWQCNQGWVPHIVWKRMPQPTAAVNLIPTYTEIKLNKTYRKIYFHGKHISPTGIKFAPWGFASLLKVMISDGLFRHLRRQTDLSFVLYLPVYLPVFAVEAVVPHTKNRTLFTDLKFSKGGVCFFLWWVCVRSRKRGRGEWT